MSGGLFDNDGGDMVMLPPRTHNLPSLTEVLAPDIVQSLIDAELDRKPSPDKPSIRERRRQLVDMCKRFVAVYGENGIPDDTTDGIVAACLAQVSRYTTQKTGTVDAARIKLKEPVLMAGRLIDGERGKDGPFGELIRAVTDAAAPVIKLATAYKVEKERIAREKAESDAKALRDQAEAAEYAAASGSSAVTWDDAARAYDAVEKAETIATAKPADLTRAHGNDFGTTSLRYVRKAVIVDPALVPRQYCVPSQSLINAAIGKAGEPMPVIPGVTITDEPDLTVRK